MQDEQLRQLQVQARRGELVEKYQSRGLFRDNDGGYMRLVMAPVEDLMTSFMKYIK